MQDFILESVIHLRLRRTSRPNVIFVRIVSQILNTYSPKYVSDVNDGKYMQAYKNFEIAVGQRSWRKWPLFQTGQGCDETWQSSDATKLILRVVSKYHIMFSSF